MLVNHGIQNIINGYKVKIFSFGFRKIFQANSPALLIFFICRNI
jgi:hypothetical protein